MSSFKKCLMQFAALTILSTAWPLADADTATVDDEQLVRIQASYTKLATELGRLCPTAAPEDQIAFDHCRQALYGDSLLRRSLPPILLWGRARGQPLKETPLTQFAPDVYAGLYAPLFMFAGTAQVEYDERERLYKATLSASFRNRLAPGQFPYPFWHDKTEWSSYQSATAILFFIDPKTEKIKVAQFLPGTPSEETIAKAAAQADAFDGQWLWTDAAGHTQPQATLFDGLYSPKNPYLSKIESTYRALALELREGECSDCHKPDNPEKMKRLVLMQTPAHAAGEIKRILRSVRDGSMPQDSLGVEKPLDKDVRARLLKKAEAFDAVLTSAKNWEKTHVASQPSETAPVCRRRIDRAQGRARVLSAAHSQDRPGPDTAGAKQIEADLNDR